MPVMDIEIHLDGRWVHCAQLTLSSPTATSRRGGVSLRYDDVYAGEHLYRADHRALSVNFPVDLQWRTLAHWPAFLIDLLPQGAARRRLERLSAQPLTEWELLQRGALNPVGNLRIRNAARELPPRHPGFTLADMLERGDGFIDHAHAVGATVAGATDTQGEAPKFWVVQDCNGAWHPDDGEFGGDARRHALLKLQVPESGPRALDMLRTEAAYQRVAHAVGLRVTSQLPEFIGDKALLVPRFDRRVERGREIRLGVESLYSIAKVLDADTPLQHHAILIELSRHLTDFPAELLEYVRRDILNIALGNRDNHGRNTAVLKDIDGSLRLAPLYDVGPAFLDARVIARRIRWDGEALGGEIDWMQVLANLRTHFEEAREAQLQPPVLLPNLDTTALVLKSFAPAVRELPSLMRQTGVEESIVQARAEACQRMAASLDAIQI